MLTFWDVLFVVKLQQLFSFLFVMHALFDFLLFFVKRLPVSIAFNFVCDACIVGCSVQWYGVSNVFGFVCIVFIDLFCVFCCYWVPVCILDVLLVMTTLCDFLFSGCV